MATTIYSAALHEVSRYGAHWLLLNGLLPYGRTHKACQLKPNFASVLGLVPPIVCQLYTTAGCNGRPRFLEPGVLDPVCKGRRAPAKEHTAFQLALGEPLACLPAITMQYQLYIR